MEWFGKDDKDGVEQIGKTKHSGANGQTIGRKAYLYFYD
jgi:hypothetical protein